MAEEKLKTTGWAIVSKNKIQPDTIFAIRLEAKAHKFYCYSKKDKIVEVEIKKLTPINPL